MLINRGMAQYDGYILSILSLGVLILCANLQVTSDMLITFLCNLGGSLCIMHCFVLSSGWKSCSTSSQRTPRGELWFIARRGGTGRLWWWCWSGWSWQDGPMTSPYLAFISCSFCFWLNFLWSDLISNYYWQHRLANVLRKNIKKQHRLLNCEPKTNLVVLKDCVDHGISIILLSITDGIYILAWCSGLLGLGPSISFFM